MEKIIKFINSDDFKINSSLVFFSFLGLNVFLIVFTLTSVLAGVAENMDDGLVYAIKVTIFFSIYICVLSLLTSEKSDYYVVCIITTAIIASASFLSLIQEGFNSWYFIFLGLSFIFPLPPDRCPYKPRRHFLKKIRDFIFTNLTIKLATIALSIIFFRFVLKLI